MAIINNEEMNDLTLDQRGHLYAVIAWNGENFKKAKEIVKGKTNEELEQITWANNSLISAQQGILARKEGLKTDKKYVEVIKILVEIHDKWVQDNAKKYNRDAQNEDINKVDKRLYQHLPTALIGINELAKDMMFLQPYLEAVNIHIGSMSKEEYGEFIPAKEVVEAYQQYVEAFKIKNNITELTPESVNKVIDNYSALQGKDETSIARVAYMKERTELLTKQAKQKNPEKFQEQSKDLGI